MYSDILPIMANRMDIHMEHEMEDVIYRRQKCEGSQGHV